MNGRHMNFGEALNRRDSLEDTDVGKKKVRKWKLKKQCHDVDWIHLTQIRDQG
jgi:hypothetical protein